jgi:membrane-associated protease RseP (regulator of RpoE activity)
MSRARSIAIHASLFVLTFLSTTIAGVQWLNKNPFELSLFPEGLPYALCILLFLTAHEFGHYFAARRHGIDVTLPYYIPMPSFLLNPFGTMGAVIRIKSPLASRRVLFDVGISGPIAGFIVAIGLLVYGFITLPDFSYLQAIHPDYMTPSDIPRGGLTFGSSLLYSGLERLLAGQRFVPPMNEIYHYPYLCVGWFGLFVTALNLMPVGQLDGGHILYALAGKHQGIVARIFFGILILLGIGGLLGLVTRNVDLGGIGWLVWAAILYFFIKLDHPEIHNPEPLDDSRRLLGWTTLALFVLMFPPIPFFDLGL